MVKLSNAWPNAQKWVPDKKLQYKTSYQGLHENIYWISICLCGCYKQYTVPRVNFDACWILLRTQKSPKIGHNYCHHHLHNHPHHHHLTDCVVVEENVAPLVVDKEKRRQHRADLWLIFRFFKAPLPIPYKKITYKWTNICSTQFCLWKQPVPPDYCQGSFTCNCWLRGLGYITYQNWLI